MICVSVIVDDFYNLPKCLTWKNTMEIDLSGHQISTRGRTTTGYSYIRNLGYIQGGSKRAEGLWLQYQSETPCVTGGNSNIDRHFRRTLELGQQKKFCACIIPILAKKKMRTQTPPRLPSPRSMCHTPLCTIKTTTKMYKTTCQLSSRRNSYCCKFYPKLEKMLQTYFSYEVPVLLSCRQLATLQCFLYPIKSDV